MENVVEGEFLTPPPTIKRNVGESITMSFIDAMKKIIEGDKVTRISWGNNDYCLMKDGWLKIFIKSEKDTEAQFHNWSINDGDIEGEDWIVLKDN